jgi:uridine kinase
VDLPVYDFAVHRRTSAVERAEATPVILLEGILVLADPALRACFDLAVYVHADDDVRLARRILRDVAERGRRFEDVIRQWLNTVRPAHRRFIAPSRDHAALVLDGEADPRFSAEELVRQVGLLGA